MFLIFCKRLKTRRRKLIKEGNALELKNFVLNEFSKINLAGIKVVDFSIGSSQTRFLVAIEHSTIDFVVKNDKQFDILSVVHQGKRHESIEFLAPFNDFVADLIAIFKPFLVNKIDEHTKRYYTIEYREKQASTRESQLKKRTLEIQAREQLLEFQMQAIDVENQFLEEERLRKLRRESNVLYKRFVILGVAILIVLLGIFIWR